MSLPVHSCIELNFKLRAAFLQVQRRDFLGRNQHLSVKPVTHREIGSNLQPGLNVAIEKPLFYDYDDSSMLPIATHNTVNQLAQTFVILNSQTRIVYTDLRWQILHQPELSR